MFFWSGFQFFRQIIFTMVGVFSPQEDRRTKKNKKSKHGQHFFWWHHIQTKLVWCVSNQPGCSDVFFFACFRAMPQIVMPVLQTHLHFLETCFVQLLLIHKVAQKSAWEVSWLPFGNLTGLCQFDMSLFANIEHDEQSLKHCHFHRGCEFHCNVWRLHWVLFLEKMIYMFPFVRMLQRHASKPDCADAQQQEPMWIRMFFQLLYDCRFERSIFHGCLRTIYQFTLWKVFVWS